MKVSVVIPNFNGAKLLHANLPKILSAIGEAEVIIVDDVSTDDSLTMLAAHFPEIKVVSRKINEGFASSITDGVNKSSGDLVLLLNSDVVPEPNFVKYLLPHFKDPEVFAVGCLQRSGDWKGKTVHGRGIGKFEKGFLLHGPGEINKNDTLWVFAGAGMFRKSIWEKLGGMDKIYNPFYWEDIDLSYRALKAGFKLVFEPRSVVDHRQKQGAIRSNFTPQQVKTIAYRNQILFVWLNITDVSYLVEHLIYFPYHLTRALLGLDFQFLKGFILATLKFNQVFTKRNRNKNLFKISDRELLTNFQK